jgi:hypothetical protein
VAPDWAQFVLKALIGMFRNNKSLKYKKLWGLKDVREITLCSKQEKYLPAVKPLRYGV